MTAPADSTVIHDALIVLGAAAIVVPIFHSLKVSPVLGYILIGMIVGPFGLGALAESAPWLAYVTIAGKDDIALVAEFGVVLLLFTIGLELSLERLKVMRKLVFGLGTLQVAISATAIGTAAYLALGNMTSAVVLGMALAMSSTAVVLQVLSDRKQMSAPVGRASFAILLFQDMAVVPILFLVGAFGAQTDMPLALGLGKAMLQAVAVLAVIVVLGLWLLRPLFRLVAATASHELFMATTLFVVLGSGVLSAAAGLSMALGAFVGGLLLAETEYRRAIEEGVAGAVGVHTSTRLVITEGNYLLLDDGPWSRVAGGWNWSKYCNKDLDARAEQADAMADPEMIAIMPKKGEKPIFDYKRMVYGGFKVLVDL